MSNEVIPGNKNSFLPVPVALFILPAYIYICSYQYEKGICDYYGIPYDLIKLDLTTSLYYSVSIFYAFVVIYYLPHLVFSILHDRVWNNPQYLPFLRNNTVIIVIFSAALYVATYEIAWLNTFLVFLMAVLIANFLALMQFSYIKKELEERTYDNIAEKWNFDVKNRLPIIDFPDIFNIRSFLYKMTMQNRNLIFILFVLIYSSSSLGESYAYKKDNYEISTIKNNYIILRTYGDNLILKKYDPKTNKLKDSTILIKLGPTIEQPFLSKKIGRLYSPSL